MIELLLGLADKPKEFDADLFLLETKDSQKSPVSKQNTPKKNPTSPGKAEQSILIENENLMNFFFGLEISSIQMFLYEEETFMVSYIDIIKKKLYINAPTTNKIVEWQVCSL